MAETSKNISAKLKFMAIPLVVVSRSKNMASKLDEAQSKLRFADYLLQRGTQEFTTGAMKHILQAANLAVAELLSLDEKTAVSPALARQKLSEGSPQEQDFSVYFLSLWKLTTSPALSTQDVANAYKRVKIFLDYVKSVRIR